MARDCLTPPPLSSLDGELPLLTPAPQMAAVTVNGTTVVTPDYYTCNCRPPRPHPPLHCPLPPPLPHPHPNQTSPFRLSSLQTWPADISEDLLPTLPHMARVYAPHDPPLSWSSPSPTWPPGQTRPHRGWCPDNSPCPLRASRRRLFLRRSLLRLRLSLRRLLQLRFPLLQLCLPLRQCLIHNIHHTRL